MREKVIKFYNNYANELIFQKDINHVRYQFIDKLAQDIIKSNHTVLDLGCGIGTTSVIISNYCKEIVAVDFAPRALEFAEKRKNISYHCCDIANINFERTFDFICVFDVLEHIETVRLSNVFNAITKHMSNNTNLLIILPYWKYLDYKRIHHSEKIQLIDNSISLNDLLLLIQNYSLEIIHYEVLTLFHPCDYLYIRIRQDIIYEEILSSKII